MAQFERQGKLGEEWWYQGRKDELLIDVDVVKQRALPRLPLVERKNLRRLLILRIHARPHMSGRRVRVPCVPCAFVSCACLVEVAALFLEVVEEHLVEGVLHARPAVGKVVAAPVLHHPQQPVGDISAEEEEEEKKKRKEGKAVHSPQHSPPKAPHGVEETSPRPLPWRHHGEGGYT